MKTLFLIMSGALIFCSTTVFSKSFQVGNEYYPKEGDTIQNYIFNDIINYRKKEASINDFRGKWLILDWWAPGCIGCIASFPKMNHLDQVFKDRVKVMMIGLHGKKKGTAIYGTKDFYSLQEKQHNLKMTAAFDSASFDKFGLSAVPLILVINPSGVIVAKTLSIDSTQLESFMSGKKVPYNYAYSHNEKNLNVDYNINLPMLSTGKQSNGGIDTSVISRRILTNWSPRMPESSYYGFDENGQIKKPGWALAMGFDLQQLVQIAYNGNPIWGPMDSLYTTMSQPLVLELRNKGLFAERKLETGENTYSYSINAINLNPKRARRMMLEDIERTFGLKTSIEKRKVPVWKLIVINMKQAEKLKTKGGKLDYDAIGTYGGFYVKNWPINDLSQTQLREAIRMKENNFRDITVLINQTGLNYNIDLVFKANISNFNEVKKELNKNGLDLIKEPFEMKCIVVRDNDEN